MLMWLRRGVKRNQMRLPQLENGGKRVEGERHRRQFLMGFLGPERKSKLCSQPPPPKGSLAVFIRYVLNEIHLQPR